MYSTIQMFKTLIFGQHTTYFYVNGSVPCLTDTVLRWSWCMSQWLKRSVYIIAFKGLAWPAGWDQDLSLHPHRNTSELWPLPMTSTIDLRLCRVRTVNPSLASAESQQPSKRFSVTKGNTTYYRVQKYRLARREWSNWKWGVWRKTHLLHKSSRG